MRFFEKADKACTHTTDYINRSVQHLEYTGILVYMAANIKRDYMWNTLGVILQNAISPLLLVAVARLNGVEAIGVFSFAFAVSLLMWSLAMWGGRTYQVSDSQSEFEHRSYIAVRVILATVVLLVTGIFCLVNQYDAFKTGLIFVLVAFKILESFADVMYGILQVHNRLYISGRSLAVKAVLGLLAFVVIDLATENLLLAVTGIISVNIAVFVFYDLVQADALESVRFPRNKVQQYIREAGSIIRRCFGVFVIFFLAMFSLNIPRYFIDIYDEREVGYFGILAMPITLVVLMISFILQPNVLLLSRLYHNHDLRRFRGIVYKILGVSLCVGVAILSLAAICGTWVLHLIFGIEFEEYWYALMVILIGGIASALVTVYLNIYVIMRRINFALIVLIVTNIVLVPVSLVAVQKWGLIGGVWAFSATNILQLFLVALYFVYDGIKGANR